MSNIKDIELEDPIEKRIILGQTKELNSDFPNASPIERLILQEPDFMSNMYTIYLLVRSLGESVNGTYVEMPYYSSTLTAYDLLTKPLSTPYDLNYSIFAIKCTGINIPQKKQTLATPIKFLTAEVPKIASKVEQVKKGSITVDLDQSMYLLDGLHLMSGSLFTLKEHAKDAYTNPKLSWQPVSGDYYFTNLFPLLGPNGKYNLNDAGGGRPRLDIVVTYASEYRSMANPSKSENEKNIRYDERYLNSINKYILEDVRFLGRSSSIKFTQASADKMQATFDYTFKRVSRTQE